MIKTYLPLAMVISASANIILLSHLKSLAIFQHMLYHHLSIFITALLTAVFATIGTVLALYEKNSYNAIAYFGLVVLWGYNAYTSFKNLRKHYNSNKGNKKNHKGKESL